MEFLNCFGCNLGIYCGLKSVNKYLLKSIQLLELLDDKNLGQNNQDLQFYWLIFMIN